MVTYSMVIGHQSIHQVNITKVLGASEITVTLYCNCVHICIGKVAWFAVWICVIITMKRLYYSTHLDLTKVKVHNCPPAPPPTSMRKSFKKSMFKLLGLFIEWNIKPPKTKKKNSQELKCLAPQNFFTRGWWKIDLIFMVLILDNVSTMIISMQFEVFQKKFRRKGANQGYLLPWG